jgi:hypothetical protein
MIKASKFAIAMAVAGPLAIATAGESFAAPVSSSPVTVKAAAPAATDVQYRTYFDYGYGPYAYRPAYNYGGYTYWYPSYWNWGYPRYYYYWR